MEKKLIQKITQLRIMWGTGMSKTISIEVLEVMTIIFMICLLVISLGHLIGIPILDYQVNKYQTISSNSHYETQSNYYPLLDEQTSNFGLIDIVAIFCAIGCLIICIVVIFNDMCNDIYNDRWDEWN